MDESQKNNQRQETILHNLIEIGQRMYGKQYVVATDGNLSHRLPSEKMLITKSATCKGDLEKEDFVVCGIRDNVNNNLASSELAMHRTVYKLRPDVNAVIHAHPPYVVALNLTNLSLVEPYLPEIVMTTGSIPTAQFSVPSSQEVANAIEEYICSSDSIILDRHGSLNVGKDLWDAYWKLERMEFAAKTLLLAHQTGTVKQLTEDQLSRLGIEL